MSDFYVENLLNEFKTFDLNSLNNLKFLDRYDKKYLINEKYIIEVLKTLTNDYNILEINKNKYFDYYNIYFDTPNFRFYRNHHNNRKNRFKIRLRKYIDVEAIYLEVKYKTNKNQTLKERKKIDGNFHNLYDYYEFLNPYIDLNKEQIEEKMEIVYKRITLLNKENTEKITFDFDICFKNIGTVKRLNNIVLAESKSLKRYKDTHFTKLLNQYRIRPMSFSKYCTGCALLFKDLKRNRFKENLTNLEKITEDGNEFVQF